MKWKVGQKVVALCDVNTYNQDGTISENYIKQDKVYRISAIEQGCCVAFLDVDISYRKKGHAAEYKCKKCKKNYLFKENESILFNEEWFRPIDDNESKMSKAVRKISTLFSKKKIDDNYFIEIKIRKSVPLPFTEPKPKTNPERKIEVQPKREEECV